LKTYFSGLLQLP